ncbi:MAG: T9SS type A sorting domain-containing protein [candidate division KSB1 bacterium]|nr:T9SS type A sorting domain-containing protein [candidate division KSB1 bacterium]
MMKGGIIAALIIAAAFAGSLHAAPSWFDANGVLHVPKAAKAPVIDGLMDPEVYSNVFAAPDTACYLGVREPIFDWWDFYVMHRMVWKDNMLYIWVCVQDDILYRDPGQATWQADNVELYFDGDESRGTGVYDGVDDIQLRWTFDEAEADNVIDVGYGSSGANWGFDTSVIEWAIALTEHGYNLEVAIPYPDLNIEVGRVFGFETQTGDNDGPGEGEVVYYRWKYPGLNPWTQTINHGSAVLDPARTVSDVLDVRRIDQPPVIDGKLDDIWHTIPTVSQNTYVTIPEDQYQEPIDWNDLWMNFKAAWDDENFYLYIDVVDDVQETTTGQAWEKDGIELYFDGLNEKSGTYDKNDKQTRWILHDNTVASNYPNSKHAFADTEYGWAFEIAIPFSDLHDIDPAEGHEFGFEIQVNDNDGDSQRFRETMARWWSPDNDSWRNSTLFGNAVLAGKMAAVKQKPVLLPSTVELAQNYPNPFNASTQIRFSLPREEWVRLDLYSVDGRLVKNLLHDLRAAGEHRIMIDASDLSSGIYLYQLKAGSEVLSRKLTLLK